MDSTPVPLDTNNGNSGGWVAEATLVLIIAAWVLYELYGRVALEWLSAWTAYIRIGGGILVILYLWYTVKETPDGATTALDLAKQFIREGSGTTTREKRNVTGLMKKKVAADQQWKCGHCNTVLDVTYEVDHKVALFNGGSNDMSNLVALCPNCHRKKTVAERLA
jgi:hypothetical protein